MEINKVAKNRQKFYCKKCNYTCSKLSDWNKHNLTRKHNMEINGKNGNRKSPLILSCEKCNKTFKTNSGLWKHKKNCKINRDNSEELSDTDTNSEKEEDVKGEVDSSLVLELLKDNKEMRMLLIEQNKQMMELAKKAGTTNNIVNNTVNNNKFNLNVFLNEKCKDAMTLKDFVKSIEVTVKDFINTGEVGFVNGISQIMLNRINDMEIQDRPLHCTDLKRETIYIKDDEKWEKDENKQNLRKAVKQVANKNYYTANDWMDETPNSKIMGTKEYEDFFKYANESTGGVGEEQTKSFEDKIMKNVMKEVTIDKEKALE
tara:strand:+ start:13426 stop:14373 length:948 start_codon:yes stop_codon:yes gene_type:complete